MDKKYYDLAFLQKEELKILEYFDQICQENGFEYSLSGGTLLGAVRHGGFIPWDDDVDVMMPRQQYEEFSEWCKHNLNEKYFFQTIETDCNYLNGFGKLINLEIPALIHETEMLDIKKGLCIDIFPIDKCAMSPIQRKMDIVVMSVCSVLKYANIHRNNENLISNCFHRFVGFVASIFTTKKICKLDEKIRTKYLNRDSNIAYGDYVKPPYKLTENDIYPHTLFEEYDDILFEGRKLRTVKDYKMYLCITFGDYMKLPEESKRVPEHCFYYYSE